MRFTVPQFIEHEAKIVGPLTFKQFIFFGLAGAACFILYFNAPFYIFFLGCLVLGSVAASFAFLKVGGRNLITVFGAFLKFLISPKFFLWKKKEFLIQVIEKEKKEKATVEEEKDKLPLKIAAKSQLKKIRDQIELTTK